MNPAHEQFEHITQLVDISLPEGALLELLEENRPLRVKLGIDPTAPDVTLGWAVVFDLPNVTPLTASYVDKAGLADRIAIKEGDYNESEFGSGFGMVLLSAICHINSPEQNVDLLRRTHAALRPGGLIVISDFILDEDGTGPVWAALFSLNMLVGTKSGASYEESAYRAWLDQAGFDQIRKVSSPGPIDLILARRP